MVVGLLKVGTAREHIRYIAGTAQERVDLRRDLETLDERVTVRRKPRAKTAMRWLGRAIQVSLKGDRRRRVEEAETAVEALLGEDPPNAKEAWRRMKGWYQASAQRGSPPA